MIAVLGIGLITMEPWYWSYHHGRPFAVSITFCIIVHELGLGKIHMELRIAAGSLTSVPSLVSYSGPISDAARLLRQYAFDANGGIKGM